MLKADQQRVRALLTETVALLCKNGLSFRSELCIEGLIGVTLDCEEIFLVNIKETIKLNSPASSSESIHARAAVEPTPSSKTSRRQTTCAEISSQTATDCTPSSTKPKQPPLATSNVDDTSVSGCSFSSPAVPSSVKNQPEDATSVPPPPNRLSGASPVSFHDVPIKLDSALCSKTLPEDAFQPSEAHPSEPAQKRLRTQPQRRSVEKKSTNKPQTPKMPSRLSSSKQEQANVIEIKEESLSDEELTKHSATDYQSYDDYSAMTAYGVGDFDAGKMFGESSFRTEATFHEEMQAQTHGADVLRLQCRKPGRMIFSGNTGRRISHRRSDGRHVCPVCGRTFTRLDHCKGHLATWHNIGDRLRCSLCPKEFGYTQLLKRHVERMHAGRHFIPS